MKAGFHYLWNPAFSLVCLTPRPDPPAIQPVPRPETGPVCPLPSWV